MSLASLVHVTLFEAIQKTVQHLYYYYYMYLYVSYKLQTKGDFLCRTCQSLWPTQWEERSSLLVHTGWVYILKVSYTKDNTYI